MLTVTIRSTVELTAAQLTEIKKALAKKYGKDIEFKEVVDPSLVAGVQIVIGSRMLDGSIKNRIQQLKNSLQQQTY
jgi:F-type H+-transporting ATPase subunit delta